MIQLLIKVTCYGAPPFMQWVWVPQSKVGYIQEALNLKTCAYHAESFTLLHTGDNDVTTDSTT